MNFGPWIPVTTMEGRIAVVVLIAAVLVACLIASHRWFSRSFFHGFLVSSGIFLSIDIIVIHWVFHLHRMTTGPEANIIEPLFVVLGIGFVAYGLAHEPRRPGA